MEFQLGGYAGDEIGKRLADVEPEVPMPGIGCPAKQAC
jgi:hypothetical protein